MFDGELVLDGKRIRTHCTDHLAKFEETTE
jgi:hypothetical protein